MLKFFYTLVHIVYVQIVRRILFLFDPEDVHNACTRFGALLGSHKITRYIFNALFNHSYARLQNNVAGILFKSPLGLSAGFDKNARLIHVLPTLGFGFAEIGSVTGIACAGNMKPRLWRLKKSQSIQVNYGLANDGSEVIAQRLAKPRKSTMPIGVSVAVSNESRIKDLEQAIDDVLKAYTDCEPFADYVTINISCPNAELGQLFLRTENLNQLLVRFNKIRTAKPVFIKMAPDLTSENIDEILNCIMHHKIDGIVCTNLTKKYSQVSQDDELHKGGVSGKAVAQQSKDLLRYVYAKTQGSLICISSGGVFSAQDAYERIRSGASLVQVLTALIYEGPQVIADMNRELDKLLARDGFINIQQAIGVDALK